MPERVETPCPRGLFLVLNNGNKRKSIIILAIKIYPPADAGRLFKSKKLRQNFSVPVKNPDVRASARARRGHDFVFPISIHVAHGHAHASAKRLGIRIKRRKRLAFLG